MRKIVIIILQVLVSYGIFAQDITIVAEAPAVVAAGEQFTLSWTANSRGGDFEAPEIKDFYILSGPQTSFSQSTQIINGKLTSSVSSKYIYYLQATKKGKFTIAPAKYTVGKKEYLSDPVEIEVVGEDSAITRSGDQNATTDQQAGQGVSSSDLYTRLVLNKKEVYIGESLVASLKIYSRVNLSGIQEVKYPDFQSFLKEDIETPPLRNLERENVNGSIYGTGILQQFLLYPQRTGNITIEPAELTVLLQQQSRSNDPFFGDFFSTFTSVPRMIASQPVEIKVKPLPPGEPESFDGAVGRFSMTSNISEDTVNVNNAITYKIVLEGQGNLKLISAPELILPPDIEIYEPKVSSDLRPSASGTSGSRIFEYVLIPRHHGEFTIPSVQYSYFDPATKEYNMLESGSHRVVVLQGDETEGGTQVYGGVSKENVRFLGKDIRYIITGRPNLRSGKNILLKNNTFLYAFPLILLLFIILIIIWRERIKRNSDIARVRNRKAAGLASRRLRQAAECLKRSDTEGFYAELLKAIWGYLGDKYNISQSEMSIDSVKNILEKNKLEPAIIDRLKEVIGKCEYSRYSPDSDISTADDMYQKAEKIIKEIENK
jgi:hypothetical protein